MSFFSMEIMPEHNTEKRNVCVHYLSLCQNTHKIIALEFYEAIQNGIANDIKITLVHGEGCRETEISTSCIR